MPVTGTAMVSDAGKALSDLLKSIASQSELIKAGFTGRINRPRLVQIINDIIRELYGTYFLNLYVANLALLTTAKVYDLSEITPGVERMCELMILMSPSGQYIPSRRWNYNKQLKFLNLHVSPGAVTTAKVIYSAYPTELSVDNDTIQGNFVGKEDIIVAGVLGRLGDKFSMIRYDNERRTRKDTESSYLTFPRKLR